MWHDGFFRCRGNVVLGQWIEGTLIMNARQPSSEVAVSDHVTAATHVLRRCCTIPYKITDCDNSNGLRTHFDGCQVAGLQVVKSNVLLFWMRCLNKPMAARMFLSTVTTKAQQVRGKHQLASFPSTI